MTQSSDFDHKNNFASPFIFMTSSDILQSTSSQTHSLILSNFCQRQNKANDVILLIRIKCAFFLGVFSVVQTQKSFRAKLFQIAENIWDEGNMNVFLFRFLLISKSAIKYERNVFVLFFFSARSGLPIHPPTQTNNNQTLIQKLHFFFCCCYCMESKAFHLLGEEAKMDTRIIRRNLYLHYILLLQKTN